MEQVGWREGGGGGGELKVPVSKGKKLVQLDKYSQRSSNKKTSPHIGRDDQRKSETLCPSWKQRVKRSGTHDDPGWSLPQPCLPLALL